MSKIVEIDGVSLNYEIFGNGHEQVILLHGWGSSLENWRNFLDIASNSKFQWIFLEMPGFGNSDDPSSPWNLDNYLDCVQKFITILNLSPKYLMAHSFGCRVSIKWLNTNHPFSKAVFVGAAGVPAKPSKFKSLLKKISPYFSSLFNKSPKLKEIFYRVIGSPDFNSLNPLMKQTFTNVIKEDLTPKLSKISAPVLLVWGKHDTYTPIWMGKIMHSLIPNSKLVIYPNSRHGLHHTDPQKLANDAINFFSE